MVDKITAEHLARKAFVYVRQSKPTQVVENPESGRLQRGLVEKARAMGFTRVEVIDEDQGRTATGVVVRSGFEQLVAAVCAGEVGAVFCMVCSRLARNGREWHHLIEFCGLVGTVLVDFDGVCDPRLANDRLLLGLKGAMSEFELHLFRQRSFEAIRAKASRGELRFRLPVGLCFGPSGSIELDPDRRVQEAVRLVFAKFEELGSARQALLWFRREGVSLPRARTDRSALHIEWELPRYTTLFGFLTNPSYAGAYAFGRKESRVELVDGRPRKTDGHPKPQERWTVLIRDHHPGYITWERYTRNRELLTQNAHMQKGAGPKSGRGGESLLAGLLRCRRCGRMLRVSYRGSTGRVPRYACKSLRTDYGGDACISFGGLRPDGALAAEILKVAEGPAIEAALVAAQQAVQRNEERRRVLFLELEQARYEEKLAARRYEAEDPDKRLVVAELATRWNAALERVAELSRKLEEFDSSPERTAVPDREALFSLAADLRRAWEAPSTGPGIKQRITRVLIQEIVADVDDEKREVVLVIHWRGGRHSELRVAKAGPGETRRWTAPDAVEVIRRMAGRWTDAQVAATLNRLHLKTGTGLTWSAEHVYAVRHRLGLPAPGSARGDGLTIEEAAERLDVSRTAVRQMIASGTLRATQAVRFAPWHVPAAALEAPEVREAARAIQARRRAPCTPRRDTATPMLPGF